MKSKMSLIISQITIPYSNLNKSKKYKLFLSSLLFIVLTFNSQAQYDYIGEGRLDVNGKELNPYVDYFSYTPENCLRVLHTSLYIKGTYYDLQSKPHTGLIKPSNKSFKFKEAVSGHFQTIKASETKGYKVGIDSFFIISNFYYKNKLRKKPQFAKYIATVEGNKYAIYYRYKNDYESRQGKISKYYYGIKNYYKDFIYLVKPKGSDTWYNLSNLEEEQFKTEILKYFGDNPFIASKINSKEYNEDDLLSIIKRAEYLEKFTNKTPIYFSKTNQELFSPKGAEYTAIISEKNDSIFTFQYSKDSILFFEIKYSSFSPNIKNGCLSAFDKNGKLRKEIEYLNDKPKEVSIYDIDMQKLSLQYSFIETPTDTILTPKLSFEDEEIYDYQFIKPEDEEKYDYQFIKRENSIKYISVLNNSNKLIDVSVGKTKADITDQKTKNTYTNKFIDGKLIESYRLEGKDTIFQIIDKKELSFERYQSMIFAFLLPEQLLRLNNLGETVYVSLKINEKRYIERYDILNEVSIETKNLTNILLTSQYIKTADNYRTKISKGKNYVKGRTYETILPITFKNIQYYIGTGNNYDWMMHQMMMPQPTFNLPNGGVAPSFR